MKNKRNIFLFLSIFAITSLHCMEHNNSIVPYNQHYQPNVFPPNQSNLYNQSYYQYLFPPKKRFSERWSMQFPFLANGGQSTSKKPQKGIQKSLLNGRVTKKSTQKSRLRPSTFLTTVSKLPKVSETIKIQVDGNRGCFLNCDCGKMIKGKNSVEAMLNGNNHYKDEHGVKKLDLPLSYIFNNKTVSGRSPIFNNKTVVRELRSSSRKVVKVTKKKEESDMDDTFTDSDYENEVVDTPGEVKIFFDGKTYSIACPTLSCCNQKIYYSNSKKPSTLTNNYWRLHPNVEKFFLYNSKDESIIKKIFKRVKKVKKRKK